MKTLLVACEESQRVCIAFRQRGWEAYSCDIIDCSGGHPEYHIKQDVLPLLNGNCDFETCDGVKHHIDRWNMLIAHPPCTELCSAGQHWFSRGIKDPKMREDAVDFFMRFINADCEHIAVENPIGIMSTRYRKPDCVVQPWQFGHSETKATCLWLKNLPSLVPTNIIKKPEGGWENQQISNGKYTGFKNYDENGKILAWNDPRTKVIRSRTYIGIAEAMAEQWTKYLEEEC
ncbi:MAG: hypothetical protein PUH11_04945 [Bacilli bacterium]|nr:hypothetical protein [Bacilli bacterium]